LKIEFSLRGAGELEHWRQADPKIFARIRQLIAAIREAPFVGIGRPEPLKGDLQGWWSRRITLADRLVYRVSGKGDDQVLQIASCRYHY
jgi:toxin YoeB